MHHDWAVPEPKVEQELLSNFVCLMDWYFGAGTTYGLIDLHEPLGSFTTWILLHFFGA